MQTSQLTYDRLYIGGRCCAPSISDRIEVRSPHDGRLIGSVPEANREDVLRAVMAARQGFGLRRLAADTA